ncbi:hypothetical protein AB0N81_13050 [Streptomyces sp. NPDC093510]|uniref:hypothetical protein n=1 Tax=Streptomyces sp. NPDC093510 TaxID=3155199 RepID=UPI003412158E
MHARVKGILATLGMTGALGAGLLLGAPSAMADGGVCNPGCEANVEFQSHGEIFTVHDYASNGVGTIGLIDIKVNGVWNAYDDVINAKGYNAPPVVVNYEIAEGTPVRYKACQHNSSGPYDCSGWYYDKA